MFRAVLAVLMLSTVSSWSMRLRKKDEGKKVALEEDFVALKADTLTSASVSDVATPRYHTTKGARALAMLTFEHPYAEPYSSPLPFVMGMSFVAFLLIFMGVMSFSIGCNAREKAEAARAAMRAVEQGAVKSPLKPTVKPPAVQSPKQSAKKKAAGRSKKMPQAPTTQLTGAVPPMTYGAPHWPHMANPQLAPQVATMPVSMDMQTPYMFNPQLAPQEACMLMSADMQACLRSRPMFDPAENPVSSALAPTTTFPAGVVQNSALPTVGEPKTMMFARFGLSGASSRAASTPALSRAQSQSRAGSPPAMPRASGAATFDMASSGTSGYSSRATTTPTRSRASSPRGVPLMSRSRSCPTNESEFPGVRARIQQYDMATPRLNDAQMFDMATPRDPAQMFSMATPRLAAQKFSMATPRVPRINHLSHLTVPE